jgi:uncharacterized phage protein (TIGR01671 family)
MREIKFQAWDVKRGKIINHPICFEAGTFTDHVGLNDLFETFAARGFILMQFTGLRDKSGREIYEGDICKTKDSKEKDWIAPIVFEGGAFVFRSNYNTYLNSDYAIRLEVIGNIYENQYLLEGR